VFTKLLPSNALIRHNNLYVFESEVYTKIFESKTGEVLVSDIRVLHDGNFVTQRRVYRTLIIWKGATLQSTNWRIT
jgi:hypothetical protein